MEEIERSLYQATLKERMVRQGFLVTIFQFGYISNRGVQPRVLAVRVIYATKCFPDELRVIDLLVSFHHPRDVLLA
jgi:hypothetical protein